MSRARNQQARAVRAISEILAAARTRFAADGFENTTTDAIAGDCGRTKGSVYHHFESKEALFEAVFTAEQRRIADAVVNASASSDPVTALHQGLAAYLHLIAADEEAARITLLDAPEVLGWRTWRRCDDGPFRTLLLSAIQAISDAGRLRPGYDPASLTELVLGATTEAGISIATADDNVVASELGRSLAQIVSDITRKE